MDNEQKRKIIKGALLVAMAGITLAEAEKAMALPRLQGGVALAGSGLGPFVDNDGGPSWVEFVKHDGGAQGLNVINPDPVINIWPGVRL